MNVFAYVEGGAVRGEVFARGGAPFAGAAIAAFGPDGEMLGETRTNDAGEFSLVPWKRCDWRILAVTGDGHQAEYTVPAEELPDELPDGGHKPAESPKVPAELQVATPTSPEPESVAPVRPADAAAELSRQVAALRRELNQLREHLRWQDVIGGIGYILGLMGLAFYFLGVQKRDRNQTPPKA